MNNEWNEPKELLKAIVGGVCLALSVIAIFLAVFILWPAPALSDDTIELVLGADGDEVVLTNTPCAMTIPSTIAKFVPKDAKLYRTYAKNAGESGIHEGCWLGTTDANVKQAESEGKGKVIRLVTIYTEDAEVYTAIRMDLFKPRKANKQGKIEGDSI